MGRVEGTSARQLSLIDEQDAPIRRRERPKPSLRLLQKDIYVELERRRRRAQIAARHLIER
jgi:hypothetical protein